MRQYRVLVVEDTPRFQQIYQRAALSIGAEVVVAASLEEAAASIDRQLIHSAVVDLSLSEQDGKNVDGLRVLELISRNGEGTRCVVITGYGTFQIGVDLGQKYKVFRAFEKATVQVSAVAEALAEGARECALSREREFSTLQFSELLKGPEGPTDVWEYDVLSALRPDGGAVGLYHFLEKFLRDLTPLLPCAAAQTCKIDRASRRLAGLYWSKALGEAAGLFISAESTAHLSESSDASVAFAGLPAASAASVGPPTRRVSSHGIVGCVRAVGGINFEHFGQPSGR